MRTQRGFIGWTLLAIIAGIAYVGASLGPIYFDDYNMHIAMKGALGDYIAFLIGPEDLRRDFERRAAEFKVDLSKVESNFVLDEAQRGWANGTVKYKRTWSFLWTKKVRTREFGWTIKELR